MIMAYIQDPLSIAYRYGESKSSEWSKSQRSAWVSEPNHDWVFDT